MKNLLQPKWLLILNLLPVIALAGIFYKQYTLIHSVFNYENNTAWKNFGAFLLFSIVANALYVFYKTRKKQKVDWVSGVFFIIYYVGGLFWFYYNTSRFFPPKISQWMLFNNLEILPLSLLLPSIIYWLLVAVIYFDQKEEGKVYKSLIAVLLIPFLLYIFSHLLSFDGIAGSLIISVIVFLTLIFAFFLIRIIYLIINKKSAFLNKYDYVWKIILTIVFPVAGLIANNQHFESLFGNFNSPWFYILAIVNGILLSLPKMKNPKVRLAVFIGKSIMYVFTLYFFIIFLPFLPFSLIAIIAFGLGFLMLTPLLLFIIHTGQLFSDFAELKSYYNSYLLRFVFILSFSLIPFYIYFSYKITQNEMKIALEYIYTPDFDKEYHIDKKTLAENLKNIKKNNRNRWNFYNNVPILSGFYQKIVFNGMTISNEKISEIEKIFLGKDNSLTTNAPRRNKDVKISGHQVSSRYDTEQKAWVSQVDFEISNEKRFQDEFITAFNLPEGCWIDDYYLIIEGRKEKGILAERKSATWVYNNIVNSRRDPGILYYEKGRRIVFRVFPVEPTGTRKTGITFIHKEPVDLLIDDIPIHLGNKQTATSNENQLIETQNAYYFSAKFKENLDKISRRPYFHFMVDVSSHTSDTPQQIIDKIDAFVQKNHIPADDARISFVNAETHSIPFDANWQKTLQEIEFEGGFFLDYAFKKSFYENLKNPVDSYPVYIVVSDNFDKAILTPTYKDYEQAFPESDQFYVWNGKHLESHSFTDSPYKGKEIQEVNFRHQVLAYPDSMHPQIYLPDNRQANIAVKKLTEALLVEDVKTGEWLSGMKMQAEYYKDQFLPKRQQQTWLPLVKASFRSQIMMPYTAYISVENEAQKAVMLDRQKKILASDKNYDMEANPMPMSEPNVLLLLLLLGIFAGRKRIKKLIFG